MSKATKKIISFLHKKKVKKIIGDVTVRAATIKRNIDSLKKGVENIRKAGRSYQKGARKAAAKYRKTIKGGKKRYRKLTGAISEFWS